MAKSKDLIKKHAEGVTHNTLGNLITLGLAWGGAAVISALATYSGFLSGLPLYLLIFWGAVIFLILAAALNFVHLFVVRRRRLQAGAIDEQQQIATEPSSDEEVESDELKTEYKRLHEKADEQREDISEYVKLKEVYFCYQYLDAPERLRSVFALDILNKSVFNITVEDAIDGYIKFEGTPLNEKPRIVNPPIIAVPANEASITIEQSLTRAEADFIKSQNLQFAEFDLEDLVITITGSEPSEKVQSQPLEITRKQGVVRVSKTRKDVDELRAALNKAESEKTELQKQSEGLSQEIDRLQKEVTTQGMMFSLRENQLESLRAESEEYKAQYKWLHEIAEAQAIDISHYVILQRVVMIIQPLTPPVINFYFDIRNDSNYYITIDVPAGQYVKFENEPLSYPITVLNSKVTECPPLKVMSLNIKQPLRMEEAERINEFGERACYYFSLDGLNIFIKGGEQFTQVVTPQLLITAGKVPEFPAPNVKKLTDRIKELERGKDAIEKEKSESVMRLTSELETVKQQYGWLHETADLQARDIGEYVLVERVLLCDKRLEGDPPYIEFWLDIYNMSAFDLTVHKDEIGGRVTYRGERMLEGKEIIYDENIIPSSKRRHLNVKQYLTQGQAESIAKYTDEVLEILLNFQEVDITVSGGTQFPQVRQKSLNMPQSIGTKYMAQLMKASRDESTDDEAANASPKLKVEVTQAMWRGYVSRNEGILALIVNMKVNLTNLQRNRVDVTKFRLRVILQGIAYVSYAERGEIYESKFKDNKDEIKPSGKRLQNLNYEPPIGLEPEQPFGGWLQFFIDGEFVSDADPTPSATLTVIDVLGREYSEDCVLRRNG